MEASILLILALPLPTWLPLLHALPKHQQAAACRSMPQRSKIGTVGGGLGSMPQRLLPPPFPPTL